MKRSVSTQLVEAMSRKRFIRITRRFEEQSIRGYVCDVGPQWFLLTLVSDRLWFDGFECFRVADVKSLTVDPCVAFAETALKIRKERKPRKPRIEIGSIERILLSAGRAFPLVAIHREKLSPDTCHIGRVINVKRATVSLLEIGPDAEWDIDPIEYNLREITRVNFGGDYEDALHIVGGSKQGFRSHARP